MLHTVIISIASNRCQREKLAAARGELDKLLIAPSYTTELWTEPYGQPPPCSAQSVLDGLPVKPSSPEPTSPVKPTSPNSPATPAAPVSSPTPLYLNQLVSACYKGTLSELTGRLKQLEVKLGRTEQERKMGIVAIDLDLMLFDNKRLHLRDWERPYIQQLIKEF